MGLSVIPRIAILLVYRRNKPAFLARLNRLDAATAGLPVTLMVADAAAAISEHLWRKDIMNLQTPVQLIRPTAASPVYLYNALMRASWDYHEWLMLLTKDLTVGWQSRLLPWLRQTNVGCYLFKGGYLYQAALAKRLKGFREQYYTGRECLTDFQRRLLESGAAIRQLPVELTESTSIKRIYYQTNLDRYFAIRNRLLSGYLHTSKWKWLWVRCRIFWWDGMIKAGFLKPEFRQAWNDFWRLN